MPIDMPIDITIRDLSRSEKPSGDTVALEDDGCPTEGAVLKREWRRLTAEIADLRAQVSRLQAGDGAVPDGFALVPINPTVGMLIAGNHCQPGDFSASLVYTEMVQAAQRGEDVKLLLAARAHPPAAPALTDVQIEAVFDRHKGAPGRELRVAIGRALLAEFAAAPALVPLTDEHQYRLLQAEIDRIAAADEFLSEDAQTWAIDPNGIFVGMVYGGRVLRPARRRISGLTVGDGRGGDGNG